VPTLDGQVCEPLISKRCIGPVLADPQTHLMNRGYARFGSGC
jgi:hypothetical protein